MQQVPRVVITLAALALGTALAPPAGAANRIALVGCDLIASDGPSATFLQISGEFNGGNNRHPAFAIESNGASSSEDVAGRSCARVLADLVDDGFAFRSAEVSGRLLNQWVSIWQANN